jgi:uncharacterized protein YndB with AHSA1/START domain
MHDDPIGFTALRQADGYFEGKLELNVDQTIDEVWKALTAPERLVDWLAPGRIEPRLGGSVRIDFEYSGIQIESSVTAFEAERLLEYSWSSGSEPLRPVRWELSQTPEGAKIVLSLRIPEQEDVARGLAGWAAHLEMLAAALAGVSVRFPFERFKAMRARLGEQAALSVEGGGARQ